MGVFDAGKAARIAKDIVLAMVDRAAQGFDAQGIVATGALLARLGSPGGAAFAGLGHAHAEADLPGGAVIAVGAAEARHVFVRLGRARRWAFCAWLRRGQVELFRIIADRAADELF